MSRPPTSRRRRRFGLRAGLWTLITVAIVWFGGLIWYASLIPRPDPPSQEKSEAIVVLTGGSRRLGEGLDLLSRGLAEKLFVSGVYQGIDVRKLLSIVKRKPEDLETMINVMAHFPFNVLLVETVGVGDKLILGVNEADAVADSL